MTKLADSKTPAVAAHKSAFEEWSESVNPCDSIYNIVFDVARALFLDGWPKAEIFEVVWPIDEAELPESAQEVEGIIDLVCIGDSRRS